MGARRQSGIPAEVLGPRNPDRRQLRVVFHDSLMLRAALYGAVVLTGALFAQRPFRQFPGVEYDNFPLPQDWNEKTEWVFARLMYPWNGWGFRYGDDWTQGASHWTIDYPRSDRHIVQAIRRLTRL